MDASRTFTMAFSGVVIGVLVALGLILGNQVGQRRARAQGKRVSTRL